MDNARKINDLGKEVNERVDEIDSVATEISKGATKLTRILEGSLDSTKMMSADSAGQDTTDTSSLRHSY